MRLKFHNDTEGTNDYASHFFPLPCIWYVGRDRRNAECSNPSIYVCWLKFILCIDIIK